MIGKTISHYRILEEIGAGGMGVVYKALDTKLDRTVALKFLPPHLSLNKEEKKRFIHEAKAAAALDHSNICTVHEIGETDDSQMFIAMGYYEGQTLKEKIAGVGARGTVPSDQESVIGTPLRINDAINIAIQIAEGLNQAHKQDIIHRDIKSANIIITNQGVAKILDFGLAKLRGVTKLTQEGTTMGTVAYMSPEQASAEKVDHRSDIWSLGVIMYEMVTGRLPFEGEYEQAVMYAIMNEEPEPPTSLRTAASTEIERIIAKTLAKDPRERYQHLDDLLVDLRGLKSSGEKTPATHLRKKDSRKKTAALTVALAMLIALVALFYIFGPLFRKAPQDPQARKMLVVLPFENLGQPEDEYFTDGMHEEITTRLAMVRNLGVISRSSALQYAKTDKTIQVIGKELDVQYILKGTVRWAPSPTGPGKVRISSHLIRVADDTHIWADTYDRVIDDIFQVQSDIARKVVGELNISLGDTERLVVDLSHTVNMEAYHAFLKAQYLIDRPHFTQDMWPDVIENYEKAVELDPEFALAWAELARAHARLVFFSLDLSPERREKAVAAAKRAMELKPESPKVHLSLSFYHLWISRDTAKALEELEIAEKKLPNNTTVMLALADIYEVQGRFEEMISLMKQAHELNPLSTSILLSRALAHWFLREYPEAIEVVDQTIALDPDEPWAHLYRAVIFWSWKGSVEEARNAVRKARPDHSWVPYVWFWQEIGEGKFQQALDRVRAGSEDFINIKISRIPRSLAYAYLYGYLEQPQRARQHYLEAKKFLETELIRTPGDPRLHSALGITLASLGERDRAVEEGKRAMQILRVSKDAVYGTPYVLDLALIHTILGEYESALDQIETMMSINSAVSPGWLSLDPRWDRLKDLPRYRKIMQTFHENKTRRKQ